MKIYLTELYAMDPENDEMTFWGGPEIEASSHKEAQEFCNNNGMGYLTVIGELIETIEVYEDEMYGFEINVKTEVEDEIPHQIADIYPIGLN